MITICDTGPLLAYLNRNDPRHEWAVELMKRVSSPMLVNEPVLTEVIYFLREDRLALHPEFSKEQREAYMLGLIDAFLDAKNQAKRLNR